MRIQRANFSGSPNECYSVILSLKRILFLFFYIPTLFEVIIIIIALNAYTIYVFCLHSEVWTILENERMFFFTFAFHYINISFHLKISWRCTFASYRLANKRNKDGNYRSKNWRKKKSTENGYKWNVIQINYLNIVGGIICIIKNVFLFFDVSVLSAKS